MFRIRHKLDQSLEPKGQFVQTRGALHAVAEHVLSAARYASEKRIGLRPVRNGIGTPVFGDNEQVWIFGGQIYRSIGGGQDSMPLITIREAAAFVGVEPGAPENVYHPTTPLDLDAPIEINEQSSVAIGNFMAWGWETLESVRQNIVDSEIQLWPEHFDAAFESGDEARNQRATYGVSPGDESHDAPYCYVVPWTSPEQNEFWNAIGFHGAELSYLDLSKSEDPDSLAREFFQAGFRMTQL